VSETVIVNEWTAEAAVKAWIKALVSYLDVRFGPVPAEAKERIKATTDLEVFQGWLLLALTAGSLDAFRRDAGI
jgi:hypothetical protein